MFNLIENYLKTKIDLYEHVGFVEDWVVFPIADYSDMVWRIVGNYVQYAKTVTDLETGNYYESEIFTHRFYKKKCILW